MSFAPAISGDGRYLLFKSYADLAAGFASSCRSVEVPQNCQGIYVHDVAMQTNELLFVTSDSGGAGRNEVSSISADGSWVAFQVSDRTVLRQWTDADVGIVVVSVASGAAMLAAEAEPEGLSYACAPTPVRDGNRWLATVCRKAVGRAHDAIVTIVDTESGSATLVSDSDRFVSGDQSRIATSVQLPDGPCRFDQLAACAEIIVLDRSAAVTVPVSSRNDGGVASGHSAYPSLSDDGRLVAFASIEQGIDDTINRCHVTEEDRPCFDIFVADVEGGNIELLSKHTTDGAGGDSRWPRMSRDGRFVVFASNADNLVAGDSNNKWDVFVASVSTGAIELVTRGVD